MKKFLVILLTAVLCFALVVVPASAASENTTAQAVDVLNMMGAIQGDGSGSLGLSGTLSRAQFCKIAVVVMGLSDKVGQYDSYTIFPDVPSSNWASGYVNLAVRYAGIVTGYPNGTFGPNDTITFGQAVTVLMKMLDYTTADVGSKWPDGFIEKAEEIGLTDGVDLSGSSAMTKGNAAVLFFNLLNTAMNNSTKTYMQSMDGVTVISDVFLVSANGTADNGASGAVEIGGSKNASYLPVNTVPLSLVGVYGSLVLSASGKALVFVPTQSGTTVVSVVSSATAATITCVDGIKIKMTSSPDFFFDGKSTGYADAWISIGGGMRVSAHYSAGGTVEKVLVTSVSADSSRDVTVALTDSYAVPSSTDVYINGVGASASEILKYDVISYNSDYSICSVSRRAVTGRYDAAYPNGENADTVTVMGTDFTVLDSAAEAFSSFSVGTMVTLLLTDSNAVAGVVSNSSYNCPNYGIVRSITSSNITVDLICGVTVSGEPYSSNGICEGALITVGGYSKGMLSMSNVYDITYTSYLNLTAGTMGSTALSKAVKVYECVGTSTAEEISLTDIPGTMVTASKIKFIAYDSSGKICLILLNDVTGDRYMYGVIKNGSKTETSGSFTITNSTTTITNKNGAITILGSTTLANGTYAGIVPSVTGTLANYAPLTAVTGVRRTGFTEGDDGTLYVSTAEGLIPVAESVQAYIAETDTWTTLDAARAYSDSLTVYYNKTVAEGGQVRIVVAKSI
jgi:hypothetical protein